MSLWKVQVLENCYYPNFEMERLNVDKIYTSNCHCYFLEWTVNFWLVKNISSVANGHKYHNIFHFDYL